MNKLRLLTFILLAAFFIEGCKKDTIVGTAYTTAAFQANINGSAWAPDTLSTTITYTAATKKKVLHVIGTKQQKQIVMDIILANSDNSADFALGTYNVDATTVIAVYNIQQKNSQGQYVFVPHGTVGPGSGIINITAVDPTKKLITGTFQFYSRSSAPDGSITIDNILGGIFNNTPYTFTSN